MNELTFGRKNKSRTVCLSIRQVFPPNSQLYLLCIYYPPLTKGKCKRFCPPLNGLKKKNDIFIWKARERQMIWKSNDPVRRTIRLLWALDYVFPPWIYPMVTGVTNITSDSVKRMSLVFLGYIHLPCVRCNGHHRPNKVELKKKKKKNLFSSFSLFPLYTMCRMWS